MPSNLYNAAKAFLRMYKNTHGEPDPACVEYWQLKRQLELQAHYKKKAKLPPPERKPLNGMEKRLKQHTLTIRLALAQLLLSGKTVTYTECNSGYIIADCKPANGHDYNVLIAFKQDGSIGLIVIKRLSEGLCNKECQALTKRLRKIYLTKI